MPEERKQKSIEKKENYNPIKREHRKDENEVDDVIDDLEDVLDETRERQKVPRKSGE